MVVNNIVASLGSMGFSEYESRAYLALLEHGQLSAYGVAKASCIPTSKIYEALSKLRERGIVASSGEGRGRKYVAMGRRELIEKLRGAADSTLSLIESSLDGLGRDEGASIIWEIEGQHALMARAAQMIADAKESILLSIWAEEMAVLTKPLSEAQTRGVKIASVHFGRASGEVGTVFTHPIHDTIYAERGGRGLVLAGDSSHALVGTIRSKEATQGAWSANKGFVLMAEDYIKHDIYVMKIVRRYDRELRARFGPGYELLRDVFNDRETGQ